MLTRHVQIRLMKISASFANPPSFEPDYSVRMEGRDKGIINAWLAGIDMARQRPALRAQALSDELPVLPYRGGVEKSSSSNRRLGRCCTWPCGRDYVAMIWTLTWTASQSGSAADTACA